MSQTEIAPRPQATQAVARRADRPIDQLRQMIESRRDAIAAVLPKHVDVDRVVKVATFALSKNERLLECTPVSVMQSVMTAAQLGLDCGGALGSAYLVPFKRNKKDASGRWQSWYECQLIVGYRGLIDLARRSGQIVSIEARVVWEHDDFDIEYTIEGAKLKHKPCLDRAPGAFRLVYAIGTLKDGGHQFELMSKSQVDAVRAVSKAKDDGPWVSSYDEMARKTVVKRLAKYLPISVELADAITSDNRTEFERDDVPTIEVDTPTAKLNNRLKQAAETSVRALPDSIDPPDIDPGDDALAGEIVEPPSRSFHADSAPPVDDQPSIDQAASSPEASEAPTPTRKPTGVSSEQIVEAVNSLDEFQGLLCDFASKAGIANTDLQTMLKAVKAGNAIARRAIREQIVNAVVSGKFDFSTGKIAG